MSNLSAIERAETYAAIFLKVGDRWPSFVPCDALSEVTDKGVHIGGVQLERLPDGWRLTENDTSWIVRKKENV